MGLLCVLGIPAAILVLAEYSLRAIGFGYPTRYFIEEAGDAGTMLVTNHRFTYRFFPPPLARGMIPYRFAREKPDRTFRIFLFGESAANGDPEPAYGFARHLELLLESRYPATDFEVICTAITAINSHVIVPIAKECAQIDADLWIVYMGNNEMIGPYGAGTIFGSKAPPLAIVRANMALKAMRIGQLVERAVSAVGRDEREPENWGGINMFANNTLSYSDSARVRVRDSYQANLGKILDLADQAGVPVLLSTVASNLRDCGPFASLHGRALGDTEAMAWKTAMDTGRQHLSGEAYGEALEAFRVAAGIDPLFAELQYLLGQTYSALGRNDMAQAAFIAARDYDALSVRADSRVNDLIRSAASGRSSDAVKLIDMEAVLAEVAPDGIPGKESFFEHVHFTPNANDLIARALAQQVEPLLPEPVRLADTGNWPGPGNIRARLALTMWDQQRLWSEMSERLATPPYRDRVQADEAIRFSQQQAAWLQSKINPDLDRKVYEMALSEDPDNFHLLTRSGYFMLSHEDFDGAIEAFNRVCDLFPHYEGGFQDLGMALLLASRRDEAKASFERVLELRPGYPRALKALEWIASQN